MDSQIDELEALILKEFIQEDLHHSGEINVRQAEKALHRCKALNLTPFQIHTLLGLSDCDKHSNFDYKEFAKVCVDFINDQMKFSVLVKKSEIFNNMKKPEI
jgi:hypothetical protein